MIVDLFEHTVIISQANDPLNQFLKEITNDFSKWKAYNVILNLSSIHKLSADQLLEFIPLATEQLENRHSLVVVSDSISYEDAPEELVIVPTIQEAKDVIEMDMIERDLGL